MPNLGDIYFVPQGSKVRPRNNCNGNFVMRMKVGEIEIDTPSPAIIVGEKKKYSIFFGDQEMTSFELVRIPEGEYVIVFAEEMDNESNKSYLRILFALVDQNGEIDRRYQFFITDNSGELEEMEYLRNNAEIEPWYLMYRENIFDTNTTNKNNVPDDFDETRYF